MIGSKTNPLVHFMSKWVMYVNEAGLHDHWYKQAIPNFSMCVKLPSKVTVSTSFSINNSWAMFVILLTGLGAGFIIFLTEHIHAHIRHHGE
ncbi:hypothetical protein O3P69_016411 [Scylla paramamosain]|uniref:Uncharacterized protein n=1 Tax=Scylla paramamosain TaxID=85552 RepID=A0AAW0TE97_SCYPA